MKCINITYEVGKTYTFHGELIPCRQGFHYCKNPKDVLGYYGYDKDFTLMEIEILGKSINEKDKSITDKFKVTRIITKEEYPKLLDIALDSNNNLIKQITPNGKTYQYEYDNNNNIIKTIHPNGDIYLYEYEYDNNNNKIKIIYPKGDTHQWEYDNNNNKIKAIFPNGKTQWNITID